MTKLTNSQSFFEDFLEIKISLRKGERQHVPLQKNCRTKNKLVRQPCCLKLFYLTIILLTAS